LKLAEVQIRGGLLVARGRRLRTRHAVGHDCGKRTGEGRLDLVKARQPKAVTRRLSRSHALEAKEGIASVGARGARASQGTVVADGE
jgi:hypothetical protein